MCIKLTMKYGIFIFICFTNYNLGDFERPVVIAIVHDDPIARCEFRCEGTKAPIPCDRVNPDFNFKRYYCDPVPYNTCPQSHPYCCLVTNRYGERRCLCHNNNKEFLDDDKLKNFQCCAYTLKPTLDPTGPWKQWFK
ncbi:hypothetical protein CHUAL_009254 [Chamberlinius hualienensis]